MSAKNIRAIFNSALDPRLKPLAVLLALYGHADGTSIFPSVETLGGDLGLSSRQIQRLIGELLDTGTLVNETPRTGGRASGDRRGRTTRYRLDLDALSQRSEEHKPRHQRHPFVAAKGDTHVSVSDSPRVTPASPKGDMGDAKGDMGVATRVTPVSPDLPIDLPTRSSSTFTAPDGAVSDELDESLDCTAPGSLDTHLCYAAWRSSYSSRASIGV